MRSSVPWMTRRSFGFGLTLIERLVVVVAATIVVDDVAATVVVAATDVVVADGATEPEVAVVGGSDAINPHDTPSIARPTIPPCNRIGSISGRPRRSAGDGEPTAVRTTSWDESV